MAIRVWFCLKGLEMGLLGSLHTFVQGPGGHATHLDLHTKLRSMNE